jgi:NAD(P)-dependent dehydrogenase (short-subunit alcohol dehydrogenase family)
MKGKTVLVTGSSSGIGFETAKALAQKGAEVILVARSEQKLQEAAAEIAKQTGTVALKYYTCEFSSQKCIKQLSENIHRDYSKIDVLVNNAGAVYNEFMLSEDGLEMTIATNHFAYFLLTKLLLDLIKKSDAGRIVNVSSNSHYRGKIVFESFTKNVGFNITKAYEQSKLANVLFTTELSEKLSGTGITVNALHPGVVKTDIGNKGTKWYASLVWSLFSGIGGISVEAGAKTSVYLATSEEVKGVSGKYFDKRKPRETSKIAQDSALAKKLWEQTEAMLKYL